MRPRYFRNITSIMISFVLLFLSPFFSCELINEFRLESTVFKSIQGVGQRTCCKECAASTNCQSVNYNLNKSLCELNYGSDDGGNNKTANPEYVYMDKSYCHSLTSSCPKFCNQSCNRNQKCVLTDSNVAVCITSECDPFSETTEGSTYRKGTAVGTTFLLACNWRSPGYLQFVCATHGKWVKSYDDCKCWYGTYLDINSTECTECPAGRYLPLIGQVGSDSCIDCPTGNYASKPGSENCKRCSPGYYQDEVGQTRCLDCPAGRYSSRWGAESCQVCLPGRYSYRRANRCLRCEPGSYNNEIGASSCTLCPIGYYQDQYASINCTVCATANATGTSTC